MPNEILLAFIPMFFAMDALGNLAIFAGLTQGMSPSEKHRIVVQSLWTATGLAVGFIFVGKIILNFLAISMGDFMIAGGVILFCISIVDLVGHGAQGKGLNRADLGVVPLGTPLIVGPAVLTMALMSMNQFGWVTTLVSVLANIAIVALVFFFADRLIRLMGANGAKAMSKVMYLLLAAIGVMMVRRGVVEIMISLK